MPFSIKVLKLEDKTHSGDKGVKPISYCYTVYLGESFSPSFRSIYIFFVLFGNTQFISRCCSKILVLENHVLVVFMVDSLQTFMGWYCCN